MNLTQHLSGWSRSRAHQPASDLFLQYHTGNRQFRFLVVAIILILFGTAMQANAQVTRSFTEPFEFSNVAASEPGVLSQLHVREGDRVSVGQPLAELDNQVLHQTLEIARLHAGSDAQVRSAQAGLKLHKQKYEKLRPLLAAGHANHAEVEKARAEYEAALADFELAKQESEEDQLELARIQAQVNQRIMQSPIDGWVTEIHHRPGEYVSVNNPQVATVVRLDRLRVRFYLHAKATDRLQVGRVVSLLLGEQQKQTIQATVEFISPVTDPNSGTTRVDVLIDNAEMKYRSGIPCQWIDPEMDGGHESR